VSDEFLSRLREEPRPAFAAGLEARLREIDVADEARRARTRRRRPVLVGALALGLAVAALALPPVRAAALGFLDFFRVQRFAGVPVDTERLARLEKSGIDLKALVGDQVEVIEPSEKPQPVESVAVASALAAVDVRAPSTPPEGARLSRIEVARPGAFRVRLDAARLRSIVETLGIEESAVEPAWDGATVEVHAPPVVALHYRRGADEFVLLESRSPEVALPEGVDLAELGALGLRMAGMSAREARLFARRIDWRSTLLVPVPAEGGTFREVEVGGARGLLVSGRPAARAGADGAHRRARWRTVVLWADEDRVYAATGPGQGLEVLEMAESVGPTPVARR
jgi:hypothetical protein